MDPFAVTVKELRDWLADKPASASVVITPPTGSSFPLIGWAHSEASNVIVLTGADGAYDTTPKDEGKEQAVNYQLNNPELSPGDRGDTEHGEKTAGLLAAFDELTQEAAAIPEHKVRGKVIAGRRNYKSMKLPKLYRTRDEIKAREGEGWDKAVAGPCTPAEDLALVLLLISDKEKEQEANG